MNIKYQNRQHCPGEKFDLVRCLWNKLKLNAKNSSPYMDPDRYVVTAPRFKGFERFHVNIGCDEKKSPHFLAAFFVQSRPFMFQLGAKTFRRPHLDTRFLSTFNEGLVWTSSQGREALVSHLVACLNRKNIDGLYFQYMFEEDAFKLFSLLRQKKLSYVITSSSRNWIVTLNDKNLPEPIMRLRSKVRNNIKRRENKLIAAYNEKINFRIFTSKKQIDFFFNSIEKIAKNCWQRKLNMGIVDNDIWRKIFTIEAKHKRLRCYILFVNDIPISYIFGTIYSNIYNCEVVAYDQNFSEYSPGIIILKHALNDLRDLGIKEYDFGGGEEKYKAEWGTYNKPMINFEVYGKSAFSITLWALRKTNNIIESFIKNILLNLGLLKNINKWHLQKTRRL